MKPLQRNRRPISWAHLPWMGLSWALLPWMGSPGASRLAMAWILFCVALLGSSGVSAQDAEDSPPPEPTRESVRPLPQFGADDAASPGASFETFFGTFFAERGRRRLAAVAGVPRALAISADESVLAIAEASRVHFWDRRSLKTLGTLNVDPSLGALQRVLFAPWGDLLLLGGQRGLSLWRFSLASLQVDQALAVEHLLWRHRTAGEPQQLLLTPQPRALLWSENAQVRRLDLAALPSLGDPATLAGVAWRPGDVLLADPQREEVVTLRGGEKTLARWQSDDGSRLPASIAPRFPPLAAAYDAAAVLHALDASPALLHWRGETLQETLPLSITGRSPPSLNGEGGAALSPLGTGYWFLSTPAAGWLVDVPRRRLLPLPWPTEGAAWALSERGQYLLLEREGQLVLYAFAYPLGAGVYLERLADLGASRAFAARFMQQLESTSLSIFQRGQLDASFQRKFPPSDVQPEAGTPGEATTAEALPAGSAEGAADGGVTSPRSRAGAPAH